MVSRFKSSQWKLITGWGSGLCSNFGCFKCEWTAQHCWPKRTDFEKFDKEWSISLLIFWYRPVRTHVHLFSIGRPMALASQWWFTVRKPINSIYQIRLPSVGLLLDQHKRFHRSVVTKMCTFNGHSVNHSQSSHHLRANHIFHRPASASSQVGTAQAMSSDLH